MGKVLILGAGVYQVPLIKKVKQLGYEVVVASIPGNYPGFECADEVAYIDVRDKEALLALARDIDAQAVLTAGTDVAIGSIGYVCERMGLPGIDERTGWLVTDKIGMKQAFLSHGVNTARFEIADVGASLEEVEQVAERIGYPVILKVIDSSGSRGITKVFGPEGLQPALANIRDNTRNSKFLVEELVQGREFGVQAFVKDGEISLFMPHGDYLFEGDTAVPMGHYVPFGTPQLDAAARIESQGAIEAVGVRDGAVNIDAIERDGEVFILEIGARAGATALPELVSLRFGIDYYEAIVRTALGQSVQFPIESRDAVACAVLLCSSRSGTVARAEVPGSVASSVAEVSLDCAAGSQIHSFHVGPDRCGQIVAGGTSLRELECDVQDAMRKVSVEFEDGGRAEWVHPVWVEFADEGN